MRDATGAEVRLDHGKAAASGHADWHPAGLAAYGGGRDRISLQRYIEEWTIRPNRAGIRGMSVKYASINQSNSPARVMGSDDRDERLVCRKVWRPSNRAK